MNTASEQIELEEIEIESTPCIIRRRACACFDGGFEHLVMTRDKPTKYLSGYCATRGLAIKMAEIRLQRFR